MLFNSDNLPPNFRFVCGATSIVILGESIIVCVNSSIMQKLYPDENSHRNIWRYDLNGNVIWKVEAPYLLDKDDPQNSDKFDYENARPFTSVAIKPDGRLFGHAYYNYFINPNDGSISPPQGPGNWM